MDTLDRVLWGVFMTLMLLWGVAIHHQQQPKAPEAPKARYHEPLCIDPWFSPSRKDVSYTYCKLVPMWSTKA